MQRTHSKAQRVPTLGFRLSVICTFPLPMGVTFRRFAQSLLARGCQDPIRWQTSPPYFFYRNMMV